MQFLIAATFVLLLTSQAVQSDEKFERENADFRVYSAKLKDCIDSTSDKLVFNGTIHDRAWYESEIIKKCEHVMDGYISIYKKNNLSVLIKALAHFSINKSALKPVFQCMRMQMAGIMSYDDSITTVDGLESRLISRCADSISVSNVSDFEKDSNINALIISVAKEVIKTTPGILIK